MKPATYTEPGATSRAMEVMEISGRSGGLRVQLVDRVRRDETTPQGGVALQPDRVASSPVGDDRGEHELGMGVRRGLRSDIADHLVAQLDAEGRSRLRTQHGRAHEELPDGHGRAVR